MVGYPLDRGLFDYRDHTRISARFFAQVPGDDGDGCHSSFGRNDHCGGVLLVDPFVADFGRVGEASFWLFGAVEVLASRKIPSGNARTLGFSWTDVVVLVAAIIVVRVVAGGIVFRPGVHSTAGPIHATLNKQRL